MREPWSRYAAKVARSCMLPVEQSLVTGAVAAWLKANIYADN